MLAKIFQDRVEIGLSAVVRNGEVKAVLRVPSGVLGEILGLLACPRLPFKPPRNDNWIEARSLLFRRRGQRSRESSIACRSASAVEQESSIASPHLRALGTIRSYPQSSLNCGTAGPQNRLDVGADRVEVTAGQMK